MKLSLRQLTLEDEDAFFRGMKEWARKYWIKIE